ncbi:MAG: N-acetylmuramoyl-L-alanine amidase [Acidimicrobiales bacterium]|nr:N-acetylmuramoyl-L-alanine amidase [Acidimicrobiales bacterium]
MLVGVVVVLAFQVGGNGAGDRSSTSTTATDAEESPFGPVPETDGPGDGGVAAVVTPNRFVVPVTGGEPGAWEVLTPCAETAVVDDGEPIDGAHVVLDPGHGGSETGAISDTGQSEEEINLDIALRTERLLEEQGAIVVLTRATDVRVSIRTRTAIAQALQPQAFVSIHHNAGATRSSDEPGTEIYHQLDDPGSKRLAGLIWEEVHGRLSQFGTDWVVGDATGARARRSLNDGDDFYGILRRAQGVPSALSEAAYLSNPAEDALLKRDDVRETEATAFATAIIRFLTTEDEGSGYLPPLESPSDPGGGGGTGGCNDPPLG